MRPRRHDDARLGFWSDVWSSERPAGGPLSRAFAENREILRAFGWGAFGVVAGLLFWHVAGFTEIFGDGRPAPAAGRGVVVEQPAGQDGGCTALALDRQGRRTLVEPCPVSPTITAKLGERPAAPFRPAGEAGR